MPKNQLALLILMLFLGTGCFEIVEEIDHKNDGSGNFSYLVNMSQSRERLATILSLDTINGLRIPKKSDIENQLAKGKAIIAEADGISNVQIQKDYENFIFNITFSYDSLAAMNNAAEIIHAQMSPYGKAYNAVFNIYSSGFNRKIDAHTTAFLNNLNNKNPAMLKEATYTTVYRFNRTISSPDTDAKLAGNKKAVMYRYNLANLANNPHILQQNIFLK